MMTSVAPATASVGSLVCPTTPKKDTSWSVIVSPRTLVPVTLPSCPTIINTAPPAR